jgi:hypothetical protein
MVSKTFAKAYAPVYLRNGTALFASVLTMLRHAPPVIDPVIAPRSRTSDLSEAGVNDTELVYQVFKTLPDQSEAPYLNIEHDNKIPVK